MLLFYSFFLFSLDCHDKNKSLITNRNDSIPKILIYKEFFRNEVKNELSSICYHPKMFDCQQTLISLYVKDVNFSFC